MQAFFSPRGIAVVGASRAPARIGHHIVKNLKAAGYAGPLHPVNPSGEEILGLRSYPRLADVPGPAELVVLALRTDALDAFLDDLAARQATRGDVRALVATGAGYAEIGTDEGRRRQERLTAACRRLGVRLLGPNCIGVADTRTGVDTTFLSVPHLRRGGVSLVSQSGGMVAWLYGLWAGEPSSPGLARMVNVGNAADVSLAEAVRFLGADPDTRALGVYIEGTPCARDLLDAIAGAARDKPVVVLKGGITEAGGAAAASHTGNLAGTGPLWEGTLRQAGALVARSPEEFTAFLAAAERLWPAIGGPGPGTDPPGDAGSPGSAVPLRVAILTNAGGAGVLASDALWGESGGAAVPAHLDPATREAVSAVLPPFATVGRPDGYVDATAGASPAHIARAAARVAADPGVDLVFLIVLSTPYIPADVLAREVDAALAEAEARPGRRPGLAPVATVLPAGPLQAAGREGFARAGRIALPSLHSGARAALALARYRQWRAARGWERPWREGTAVAQGSGASPARLLGEPEAARLLAEWGVPFPPARFAPTPAEAVAAAGDVGYPVVLKVASPDIAHKTDVGGVRLGVSGPAEVAAAWEEIVAAVSRRRPEARIEGMVVQRQEPPGVELLVGGLRDPSFGPVVTAGLGGIFAEVYRDVAWRLAPVTEADALEMLRELRGYPLLTGARGRPAVDLGAAARVIAAVSRAVAEMPGLREVDVNPVLLYPERAVAVDALLRLDG